MAIPSAIFGHLSVGIVSALLQIGNFLFTLRSVQFQFGNLFLLCIRLAFAYYTKS